MHENIEQAFRALLTALQTAKMYDTKHPMVQKALAAACISLQESLTGRQALTFGIIKDELSFEQEIFFELSAISKPSIELLKKKGIERITISAGFTQAELEHLVAYCAAGKDRTLPPVEEYLTAQGVSGVSAGAIKLGADARQGESAGNAPAGAGTPQEVYQALDANASESLLRIVNSETVEHLTIRFGLHHLYEGLNSHSDEFMKLVTIKRYDPATYAHVVNVCILSLYAAARLGFSKEDCIDVAMAGLFHDTGKLQISRKVLGKQGALTDDEFSLMRSHTTRGAQMLLAYADTLGLLPVVAAYEHHLKFDSSGYPKSALNRPQHTVSGIVSLCDVYDALHQRRSYKTDFPPDQVYGIMKKDRGSGFDPVLFDAFYAAVGVWPVGSLLRLADGRICVVRRVHDDAIALPLVEVVVPDTHEKIDLRAVAPEAGIKEFVNPWKEGKDLLEKI
jgi:HD-GYP domain-containing protein (c-di-GMP phosphodiesterase class II)